MRDSVPATSASDRYDAARALLSEWDAAAEPNDLGLHNAGGFALDQNKRIREVLRALVDHPEVGETANDAAMRIWGSKASADLVIATRPHHAEIIALLEAMWYVGITVAWEDWEPENAPGMVDTRHTEVVDFVFDGEPGPVAPTFIQTEFPDGARTSVGRWEKRPDGRWVIRVEIVR